MDQAAAATEVPTSATDQPIERKSRDADRDRDRDRDRNRDRDRDRDRNRDRSVRDRGGSRDRLRERDRERDRDRDKDRSTDRGRSGEAHRDRDRYSGSRRGRTRSRSYSSSSSDRSESPISRQQRLRREAQRRAAAKRDSDKYWDGFQWVQRQAGHVGGSSGESGASTAVELAQSLGIDQGASKDRRIYVGNLPPGARGEEVKDLINEALTAYIATNPATAAIADRHPPPVVSFWMSGDGKYGFIELYSASLAEVAITLHGSLQLGGVTLRISRPKAYNEMYGQGPAQPGPMGSVAGMQVGYHQ